MIRTAFSYLKRILTDKTFYICAFLICTLCFTATADYDAVQNRYLSVWDLLVDTQRVYTTDISFSAYVLSSLKGGSWLNMFLPLILPLCFANALCDDRKSGFLRYEVIRTGHRRLKCSKFISAVLSSGSCCLLGYCLYVLVMIIRFPHIAAYELADDLFYHLTDMQASIFAGVGIVGVYLVNMIDMLLYGFAMSLFSLIVIAYTENKYLVCCIPFMTVYCLTQLGLWLLGTAGEDPNNYNHILGTVGTIVYPASANGIATSGNTALLCYYGVFILLSFAVYVFFGKGGADKGA